MDSKSQIKWLPLSEIERWPRNPKKHDIPGIKDSLRRFGFIETPVRDERTGKLVAGHGRIEGLTSMRDAGEDPPGNIRVRPDGEWLVPVTCGLSFKDDLTAEAYIIASNRLTELGGWDDLLVHDIVTTPGFDALGTGLVLEMPDTNLVLDTSHMDEPLERTEDKPKPRVMRVGRFKVPLEDAEKRALEEAIMAWEESTGSLDGFVSHLLGS